MVGVAQMVVRKVVILVVAGSSPVVHPKLSRVRLAAKDTTLSRWRSRVQIPYAGPS